MAGIPHWMGAELREGWKRPLGRFCCQMRKSKCYSSIGPERGVDHPHKKKTRIIGKIDDGAQCKASVSSLQAFADRDRSESGSCLSVVQQSPFCSFFSNLMIPLCL